MRSENNMLCIEVSDLEACGFRRSNIDRYTSLKYDTLKFIKVKGKGKLFPWETLGKTYKEAILKKFGEPLEYLRKTPIKELVVYDLQAEQFFISLTKDGLLTFSDEWIVKNAWAASWLNMILLNRSRKTAKQKFNMSVDEFLTSVCDLIKAENINLPYSQKRLRQNLSEYQQQGYKMFIHGNTGKKSNAAKISDEKSEAYLLSLIERHNDYDDVLVCVLYNVWAKENGYKELENAATVGNWRRAKESEITIGRYGNSKMNEKYIRQVKGFAPTAPGYLWESDDNNLDFFFNSPDSVYNRYVSYIVADSHCGLILGKSYRVAKSPTVEMVRLAWIDAMYYVRSLTGGWHLPFEVKADHWQKSNLFPFFNSIGKFVPPAHANKHRGYIEQLFGSTHFKRCQKLVAPDNYNGNNVTATNPGVNLEVLKLNEKNRPEVGNEAEKQLEHFFHLVRKLPDFTRNEMNALSKEQQWLNKWNTLSDDQKKPISDEQFLMTFGIKHQPQDRPITITNRGVEPQINGKKYSYDLPSYIDMMPLITKQVNVIYDPYDMSRVLVTNGKNIRFIAKEAVLQPRALQDAVPGCRETLNMVLSEKKEQFNYVGGKAENRKIILENEYDSEAVLLSAYMPKELKNNVEHHYLSQKQEDDEFLAERRAFMQSEFDPNQEWD